MLRGQFLGSVHYNFNSILIKDPLTNSASNSNCMLNNNFWRKQNNLYQQVLPSSAMCDVEKTSAVVVKPITSYNIFLPEMYRSAFCHPFLSVGVSISFDVIILLYYNFIYFQDKDTFLRFYSRSFQTFSIYGCAASNADVVILIRVHTLTCH